MTKDSLEEVDRFTFKTYYPLLIVWGLSTILASYCNSRRNIEVYLNANNPLYQNEEELNADLDKEKAKLGLQSLDIVVKENDEVDCGHVIRREERYVISLNPKCKTKIVLRHELYHVKKRTEESAWTLENLLNGITWGEYEEWNATNYSLEE
jgi:hypothetical protein